MDTAPRQRLIEAMALHSVVTAGGESGYDSGSLGCGRRRGNLTLLLGGRQLCRWPETTRGCCGFTNRSQLFRRRQNSTYRAAFTALPKKATPRPESPSSLALPRSPLVGVEAGGDMELPAGIWIRHWPVGTCAIAWLPDAPLAALSFSLDLRTY